MQMDMDSIAPLKKQLREDMRRFGVPLQALMVKYDPKRAPHRNKETYGAFQEELGHTAKEMAYAYGKLDGMTREEPSISEAEIIQETLRRYQQFGHDFEAVVLRHGFDRREIEPLLEVIGESAQHCRTALAEVGGPRPRRTFKFELGDLLGNENVLLAAAYQHISPNKEMRQAQLDLFRQRVLPDIDKMYTLPRYVGSGKLDFDDATKQLTRMRESFTHLAQHEDEHGSLSSALAPVLRKLDAALAMCENYARDDYRAKGTGR